MRISLRVDLEQAVGAFAGDATAETTGGYALVSPHPHPFSPMYKQKAVTAHTQGRREPERTVCCICELMRSCIHPSGHTHLKALLCAQPSGSVGIAHPFHPLFRQQFMLLESRTIRGVECVKLNSSEDGAFWVPIDWTSLRINDHYQDADVPPTILRMECLIELATLVEQLSHSTSTG